MTVIMMKNRVLTSQVLIAFCISYCHGFEAVLGILIFATVYSTWKYSGSFSEVCNSAWLEMDTSALKRNMQENLFGQHIAYETVIERLENHISNVVPKKALVMVFNGWSGSGKNYVSKMISKALYKKGSASEYVHFYIATQDFPHESEIKNYYTKLQKDIVLFTTMCERSLFIFDEVDLMYPGIIDALKPYLQDNDNYLDLNFKKNMFIFLSNAGSTEIAKVALKFHNEGKERESMSVDHFHDVLKSKSLAEGGGLRNSELIKENLVDVYVPFLPLEKKHVKECVIHELKLDNQNVNVEGIDKIIDQLFYSYSEEFTIFSSSGCKKISQRIPAFIDYKYEL